MGNTKAYVMEDGEVVSEKVLDRYAIKSDGESNQIPSDQFQNAYVGDNLIHPLYNPEALSQLLELNTHHYRAVKTKARDVAGLGWYLEPSDETESHSEAQRDQAIDFLNNLNPRMTLNELNEQIIVDYESIGFAFYEVIRDGNEIVGLEHIPSHTMRIHKDMERFCQIRGNNKAWFKRFGLDKEINVETGEINSLGELSDEKKANEVLYLLNYTSRSDYYGIPDIMPALGALLGERERQEYNISFFDNHAIPAYAVTITGAELDDQTERTIKKFFKEDVKKSNHSTLVLTAKKDENDMSDEPVEFKFEALSTDTKEASFRMFRQDNRDEILSAHGVPPYRAGITVEGQLGGSSAAESTEIYKQSIIKPKQELIESQFNRYILPGIGVTDWKFRFKQIDTRDLDKEIERMVKLVQNGIYSPNMVLEELGKPRSDDPYMDKHYINGQPLGGLNEQETSQVIRSMKELHETIADMIRKGKSNNES